jgi:RNA polymerase sporulation-specific sigma factor
MDRTLELIKLAQAGDEEAKGSIVKENMGLIWSIVKRFINRGYEAEDLFQIGSIGLLKCIDKFDLNYEVKFSTYAVPMIMGEIKRFMRDDGMIKVSRPLKEMATKAKYAREAIIQRDGREPTINELAESINVSAEELALAMEAGMEVESLYSTIYQGDGSPIYLIDKLEQTESCDENSVDMIGISQVQVSRIEKKVLQSIREKL